jgi:Uma2 family endonuclease
MTTELDTKLVLGPRLAGTAMTPEEFDAVEEYDEEYCYELINGVLVVTPFPEAEEAAANEELGYWLRCYRSEHPRGSVLDATLPRQYVFTRFNRRLADRLVWTGLGRLPNRQTDLPSIVADFVPAALRDRPRDYANKRREYLEAGIAGYWIIDRFRRTLTVVRNQPGGPQELVVRENETYQPPLLPGFELPLARLLAVADAWARSPAE